MARICSNPTLPGTCGVGLFHNFRENTSWPPYNYEDPATIDNYGGSGWACAGFINDKAPKEVYEALKKRWKIVLQTPKRRNNNSGNSFFFVVYDTKKPRKSKNNPIPVVDLSGNDVHSWPWKEIK